MWWSYSLHFFLNWLLHDLHNGWAGTHHRLGDKGFKWWNGTGYILALLACLVPLNRTVASISWVSTLRFFCVTMWQCLVVKVTAQQLRVVNRKVS